MSLILNWYTLQQMLLNVVYVAVDPTLEFYLIALLNLVPSRDETLSLSIGGGRVAW